MFNHTQNAVVYTYDISHIVKRLYMSLPATYIYRSNDSVEFLIDGFLRYAIDSFEILSVADYYSLNYTREQLSWFAEQTAAIHVLWEELIFPSTASGKIAHVVRIKNRMWVIIPCD